MMDKLPISVKVLEFDWKPFEKLYLSGMIQEMKQ